MFIALKKQLSLPSLVVIVGWSQLLVQVHIQQARRFHDNQGDQLLSYTLLIKANLFVYFPFHLQFLWEQKIWICLSFELNTKMNLMDVMHKPL